ncbi:MAG: hypothetical protein LBE13_10865 [Bacteroidales bacterium]|jgi:hypothetical protein|nr:hypothetical protein [Bacteroidales bacterium]
MDIYMAVHFSNNDIVSIDDFGGINFLIPDHWKRSLIDKIQPQITLLNGKKGNEIERTLSPFQNHPFPFDPIVFHASSSVIYTDDIAGTEFVKTWLSNLKIKDEEDIYVFRNDKKWKDGCSVFVAKWKFFINFIWQNCRSGFDLLNVIDDTAQWAIMFGPEDAAIYIESGAVNSILPQTDNAYGWDLIRVRETTGKSETDNFVRYRLNQRFCSCLTKCPEEENI